MKLLSVVAALLLAATAVAASHVLMDEISGAPSEWTQLSRALPTQQLDLHFLLHQRNLPELEAALFAVSDPSSPEYGQHWTLEEVNDLVAPSEQHVSQVLQWLRSHGVSSRAVTSTSNSDMMRVRVTVEQAEAMLHTEYFEFAHNERKDVQIIRTLRYHVPDYLAEAIDVVGPTVRFPSQATVRAARGAEFYAAEARKHAAKMGLSFPSAGAPLADCTTSGTTPLCLRSLYSVNDYVASTNTTMAATGFLEQYISPTDLASFFTQFDPAHARTATIVGPNVASQPGVEASLDIQYTMGVAPGVPGVFWYTAGRQPGSSDNEPFLVFLQDIASTAAAPWVISTSYGDDEGTVAFDYAQRVNAEFQKAGVRGISVLFSSGDGGVSGGQAQQCTTYVPTYPAGSPFVTAVGGTTSTNPEVGVSFSSGGFANYAPRPAYQNGAVSDYIHKYAGATLPAQNLWNASGRGFPDVSAQGTSYPVVVGGWTTPVDGTSCSTPTFSAIVALLNDVRFKAGKSPLGFLNPLLYANPQAFQDITAGNNPGCNTAGFTAVQGWDPITGLGTPNFERLASIVKNLH